MYTTNSIAHFVWYLCVLGWLSKYFSLHNPSLPTNWPDLSMTEGRLETNRHENPKPRKDHLAVQFSPNHWPQSQGLLNTPQPWPAPEEVHRAGETSPTGSIRPPAGTPREVRFSGAKTLLIPETWPSSQSSPGEEGPAAGRSFSPARPAAGEIAGCDVTAVSAVSTPQSRVHVIRD